MGIIWNTSLYIYIPSGNDCRTVSDIEAMAQSVEIVDLPSYKMVDLFSSLCKRLPEGSFNDFSIKTNGDVPVRHVQ